MKRKQWFALLPLMAALNLPAQTDNINQEMRKAGDALSALVPYIYDDTRFRAAENQSFIASQLDQLIQTMQAGPNQQHGVMQQISQASLVDQFQQARRQFNTGNFAMAQYLLGSAPLLCSSCHIQDGVMINNAKPISRDLFANAFSYAEFNYYLRNYAVAEKAYLEYLNQSDVRNSRISGGMTLERLLDITLITDNDLNLTREKLERYKNIEGLDPELQQRLDQWLAGVEQLRQRNNTYKPIDIQMYEVFGANFNLRHEYILDEGTRPLALAWRSQLQKNLMKTDNRTEVARHLYLISILERILGDQAELSLANLYLKECVKLGVTDFSHRCLNEYESHLYFYYSGSGDGDPSPEAQEELKRLRKMARQNN